MLSIVQMQNLKYYQIVFTNLDTDLFYNLYFGKL